MKPTANNSSNGQANTTISLGQRIAMLIRHRNFHALSRFTLAMAALVTVCSLLFHVLMAYEGQQHSWVSGFYWTLSTMSTLGYGDITFQTDLGRIFSMLVLLSGMIFMLVLLPFAFIQLFYEPWMEARNASKVPREVAADTKGHVILTFYGPVASALIVKLVQFDYPYVVVLPELDEVIRLGDLGINVMYGELNDPATFHRARVEQAAMVATTRSDIANTSVVFTVRGISADIPVIATAREENSVDILKLAGSTRVLDLTHLMAEALARRTIGGKVFTHVVGRIDDLLIAEVDAVRTSLVGKRFADAQAQTAVSIVGYWARGSFKIFQPEDTIEAGSVLVMAGSTDQVKEFNASSQKDVKAPKPQAVIIIGGGRVGRATAASLKRRDIDYRIVEHLPERIRDSEKYILGSAAEKEVLLKAGLEKAPTIIITTGDDETNIYLTIFCRLLRDDIQIISRATLEQNVSALHRAGSDFVMSYSSMGANALFNLLQRSDLLMIAEGLDVFKMSVPKELAGKTLAEANIRHQTGCSVIGIDSKDKTMVNPGPDSVLPANGEIVLIGTPAGESEYLKLFPTKHGRQE